LKDPQFSDEQRAELQAALPNCSIEYYVVIEGEVFLC
jgi:hypothetical protein